MFDFTGMVSGITNLAGKFIEDKDKKNELEQAIKAQMLEHEVQFVSYQRDIITAEANSQSFLARNWRPITMLCFVAIIANNYLLFPYIQLFGGSAVKLDIPPDMWDLLKLGIGGYIAGRSVEKGIDSWKGKAK
jgi:hypothetical protein|tara:strand:+ start:706 stop:1104 length:399 start_codon:yes stop_codon:yes gene_type:complete|eukprot:GHVL01034066.1.p1 GENE.GHVL01034066.1~~GHVL01034066.1.p1  ORF type:complete len:133 (-),score=19.23 GHVL01034066.1:22-420(-)